MLRTARRIISALLLLVPALTATAQEDNAINTYSPYTLYGIGDISQPGFTASNGMAGTTIGIRNPLSIDYYNPASLSIRDTLSFLFDFGLKQKNTYAKTNDAKTSANNLNLSHISFSFRLAPGAGIVFGLKPYSDVGYDIEQHEADPLLLYQMGDILYQYKGEGNINELFIGGGLRINKNFSVGANLIYYFGNVSRYHNTLFTTNKSYSNIYSSRKIKVGQIGFSTGAQYHGKLKENLNLTIGATFRPKTDLSPRQEILTIVKPQTDAAPQDTINHTNGSTNDFFTPMEVGFGVSLAKSHRLTVGIDYVYQDWTNFNVQGSNSNFTFTADKNQTVRLGIDYVPNYQDIRKVVNRWNYRAGAYFTSSYMICNGERIKDYGMTFGLGIPITRMGSKLNASIGIGQRGTTKSGLIKETYITATLGVSIHEIWFRKYKYQ